MRAFLWLSLALPLSLAAQSTNASQAPDYTAGSIVNAASNFPGHIAPNAILSIYGKQLSWNTRAVAVEDLGVGELPARLPAVGVSVLFSGIYARLYYVSPTQINILVPAAVRSGLDYTIQVVRDGVAGPAVRLTMDAAAPGIFLQNADAVIGTRPDGSVVTRDSPAHPGDVVVIYASGLGQTVPSLSDGEIPHEARSIVERASFQLFVNGTAVDNSRILYAGVTPGFAGLYQVNLVLPPDCGTDPEIRIAAAGNISPPGTRLPVR